MNEIDKLIIRIDNISCSNNKNKLILVQINFTTLTHLYINYI